LLGMITAIYHGRTRVSTKTEPNLNRAAIWITRAAVLAFLLVALFLPASAVYAADPTVTTNAASDVTGATAYLNGTLTAPGDVGTTIYLSFQYATDEYYTTHGSAYSSQTVEVAWTVADGITVFKYQITGLAPSADYDYRARVRFGTSYAYGANVTFFTSMVQPDSTPRIHSLKVYKDLLEADDCLFVILADIPYANTPSIPVDRAFTWTLLQTGVPVGSNTGYAMHDYGYGFNVHSLYFSAASAIDWGNPTAYSLQLAGNADTFSSPPVYDTSDSSEYQVVSTSWVVSSDYSEALADAVIGIARTLEQEWQVVLMDEQDTRTVLSANGEKLFRNAIPNIQAMAPSLFYVQAAGSDVTPRTWGTSLDTTYKGRLLGADGIAGTADDTWIAAALVPVADWANIPWLLLIGLITLALCVFVIYQSNRRFNTPVPGYIGSLIIIMCMGMLALGLTILAIIGMAIVIGAGYLMFMRRA